MDENRQLEEAFGRALVEAVTDRTIKLYGGLFQDSNNPLRRNDILGPIFEDLEGVDKQTLMKLIEHVAILNTHAFLNFVTDGTISDAPNEETFEVVFKAPDGSNATLLDVSDDPGGELVRDDGWVDRHLDQRYLNGS